VADPPVVLEAFVPDGVALLGVLLVLALAGGGVIVWTVAPVANDPEFTDSGDLVAMGWAFASLFASLVDRLATAIRARVRFPSDRPATAIRSGVTPSRRFATLARWRRHDQSPAG